MESKIFRFTPLRVVLFLFSLAAFNSCDPGQDPNSPFEEVDQFSVFPKNATISVGEAISIIAYNGVRPYSFASPHPNKYDIVSQGDSVLIIIARETGPLWIIASDHSTPSPSRDTSYINVLPATPFIIKPGSSAAMVVGTTRSFALSGGIRPYHIRSASDTSIASIILNDSTITVRAKKVGTAVAEVTDNAALGQNRIFLSIQVVSTEHTIKDDLFPLVAGRRFVYSGYVRDAVFNQNVTSFTQYESRLLISQLLTSTDGFTDALVVDSSFVPVVGSTTQGIWRVSSTRIRKRAAIGADSIWMQFNLAPYFASQGILTIDTIRSVLVVPFNIGLASSWSAFQYVSPTLPVRTLNMTGLFAGIEALNIKGSIYYTFRIELKIDSVPFAEIWFAPDIGPVRWIQHSDLRVTPGFFREIKTKNF